MKKILTFFLFALIATVSFAQSNNYQDVVYLKNGSVIRGVIIEQTPNKSIKIETSDRSIFVYEIDEIEKMAKEATQKRRIVGQRDNLHLEPGYKGIVELGYQVGVGTWGVDRIKLNFINGYQLNEYFSLGIGLGLRYYHDAELAFVPIFADFRGNLPLDSKISPYVSLGIGYTLDATNSFDGVGLMVNPAVGVSFKVSEKSTMNVGIGYEAQKISDDGYSITVGGLGFNVGISF